MACNLQGVLQTCMATAMLATSDTVPLNYNFMHFYTRVHALHHDKSLNIPVTCCVNHVSRGVEYTHLV